MKTLTHTLLSAALALPALAQQDSLAPLPIDQGKLENEVRAHLAAREQGLRLLVGSQLTVTDRLPPHDERLTPAQTAAAATATPVLLATDRDGYGLLCRLASWGRRRCAKGASLLSWHELCDLADGLLLLHHDRQPPPRDVREAFGDRAYALLTRHLQPDDAGREHDLRRLGWPLVAGTEVLYHTPARRPLHDVLTCIRHGVSLHQAGTHLRPNAEHALLSPYAFAQRFRDCPDAVARTLEVASRCQFELADLRYRYPSERLPEIGRAHV